MLVRDNNLGRVLQTEHDLTDRPMGTQLRNADGSLIYRTELDYDKQNRLVGFGEEAGVNTYKTSYTYDNDNRVTEIGFGGSNKVKYTYDNLGRVQKRIVENGTDAGKLTNSYEFVSGGHGTGSTSPLIAKIDRTLIPYEYEYDSRGNIISEKRGDLVTEYEYDVIGQLVRVNDPHENATWVYEYDRGGNMTKRKKYTYTTGALDGLTYTLRSYTYDSTWKDQLVSNGSYPLTYDAMGNLKTCADWEYEWEGGRQLKKQTQNTTVVSYDYDHKGMRVRKTVSHTNGYVYAVYNYTYNGSKLVHMSKNNDVLHFFYDNEGRPASVNYNGDMYNYLYNLQGDVLAILDSTGTIVVEYKYNAWGSILSRGGSLANTLGYSNPFRYRGYIYDDETFMYWLQNRYYYPELYRFIIPDLKLGAKGMVNSHNAYTYCANNPITQVDPSGFDAIDVNGSCVGFGYRRNNVTIITWKQVPKYVAKNAQKKLSDLCKSVRSTAKKLVCSLALIHGNCTIEASAGLGVGVQVSLAIVSAGALYRNDLINFTSSPYHGTELCSLYEMSISGELGIPGIDGASIGGSMAGTHKHAYNAANCECGSIMNFSLSCPATEYDFNTDSVFTFGFSGYFLVGGTFQVQYNITNVTEGLQDIWN